MQPTVARKRPFPWHIIVFLAPAVLVYTNLMIYPLVDSLRLSFFTQDARNVESFAGLDNYVKLLTDSSLAPRFWNALGNNVVFFAVHMLVQNPIGLLLATLLSRGGRSRSVY